MPKREGRNGEKKAVFNKAFTTRSKGRFNFSLDKEDFEDFKCEYVPINTALDTLKCMKLFCAWASTRNAHFPGNLVLNNLLHWQDPRVSMAMQVHKWSTEERRGTLPSLSHSPLHYGHTTPHQANNKVLSQLANRSRISAIAKSPWCALPQVAHCWNRHNYQEGFNTSHISSDRCNGSLPRRSYWHQPGRAFRLLADSLTTFRNTALCLYCMLARSFIVLLAIYGRWCGNIGCSPTFKAI